MMSKNKPTSRFGLLKEVFSLPVKTERCYFEELESQILVLRNQLEKIERRYYSSLESNVVIPDNIRQEREELLRKISRYSNQVNRDSVQRTSSSLLSLWLFWLLD